MTVMTSYDFAVSNITVRTFGVVNHATCILTFPSVILAERMSNFSEHIIRTIMKKRNEIVPGGGDEMFRRLVNLCTEEMLAEPLDYDPDIVESMKQTFLDWLPAPTASQASQTTSSVQTNGINGVAH